MLKATNTLLATGAIAVPEPASIGTDEAPDAETSQLRALLCDLVRIADQSGADALRELAEQSGEAMLSEGLRQVIAGAKGEALRDTLETLGGELEARYHERLGQMIEAMAAIAAHETPESFEERAFGGG